MKQNFLEEYEEKFELNRIDVNMDDRVCWRRSGIHWRGLVSGR